MFKRLTTVLFLLSMAATLLVSQETKLEYKFKLGDVTHRRNVTQNTVTADMIPGGSQSSEVYMFSTESVDSLYQDGSASLIMTVDSVSTLVNGKSMAGNPQGNLTGLKFRVVKTKLGKTISAEPVGELSPSAKMAADAFKQNLTSSPGYPDKAIKQGDSWDQEIPMTQRSMGGEVKMILKLHYTFTGTEQQLGYDCTVLKITGTIKGEGSQAKFDGTLKGTMYFAVKEGTDVKRLMDTDMNIEADTPQGPQTMVNKSSQKTEIVK
jgi:hypothetical protein